MSTIEDIPPATAADTQVCEHCGETVPVGHFCGSCGAHLTHVREGQSARSRMHSFAAFPDQSVVQLSVVTAFFPHLSHRSRGPMRVTFATLWVILVGLVVAHLEAPVIAVSAAGFTVLFLLYVAETQPFEDDLFTSIATVVSGGVIGFLFAFFIGPIETRTVVSFPAPGLTSGVSLRAAILIPLLAQVGMILPLLIVWTRRSRHGEALDGFAIGAAGALGFVTAMTFTNFAPQFSGGVLTTQGFVPVLTEAVVRGITVPLLSAALTGYIGATLWVKIRERRELDAGNRWLARPGAAFLVAIALQIGMGFADLAHLNDPLILVVHLAGVLLAVVAMRIGLHHVLLHEEHTFVIGPPRACPNCHHLTPSMPFCPECGVAETATSKRHRNREASLYPGPTSSPDAEVVA